MSPTSTIPCALTLKWIRGFEHVLGFALSCPGLPAAHGQFMGRTRPEARKALAEWNESRCKAGHPVLVEA